MGADGELLQAELDSCLFVTYRIARIIKGLSKWRSSCAKLPQNLLTRVHPQTLESHTEPLFINRLHYQIPSDSGWHHICYETV